MRIRDALESDAETLATAVGRSRGAVLNMIHDRSVRVAISEESTDTAAGGDCNSIVEGFVAFDVHGGTVHVTDFDGSESTMHRLFEEPQRFASREELDIEVVVPNDEQTGSLVEAAGFEAIGAGPRFDGRTTTRYRIESDDIEAEES